MTLTDINYISIKHIQCRLNKNRMLNINSLPSEDHKFNY